MVLVSFGSLLLSGNVDELSTLKLMLYIADAKRKSSRKRTGVYIHERRIDSAFDD